MSLPAFFLILFGVFALMPPILGNTKMPSILYQTQTTLFWCHSALQVGDAAVPLILVSDNDKDEDAYDGNNPKDPGSPIKAPGTITTNNPRSTKAQKINRPISRPLPKPKVPLITPPALATQRKLPPIPEEDEPIAKKEKPSTPSPTHHQTPAKTNTNSACTTNPQPCHANAALHQEERIRGCGCG